ncbi:DUF2202 domain-containing protein [Acidithiobacillus sp. CV18-2]|nr:DUF2202 domain-containing protein [Acidithiobacillus sp. CV18-3]MBU2758151.1 DUF2202 domain-containing protein [Acidithiobacillus sp. BN09-2]MBU2776395.1 DUF2202 domain-containing protein [Acidithiobacillus sp. CV18-2]MBU2798558.1 DUF2202 domain-containing protein [Acidithiobacillus sp. VAN18-4]
MESQGMRGAGKGAGRLGCVSDSGQQQGRFPTMLEDMPDHSAHRAQHLQQMRMEISRSPREQLSPAEQEGLLLMREEEKIARDVYIRLYACWGIRPFENITGSEQVHMDAVLALLEHYGLPDPAQGLGVGEFHRAELQRLYDQLMERGLQSREDAIRVGLLIEELDIDDLQKAAKQTGKAIIRAVYAELERGSRNHLRAFYRWKEKLGISYQPQHMAPEPFERIALSPHEDCGLD